MARPGVTSASGWPPHREEARPWRTNPDARNHEGRRPSQEDRVLTSIRVSIPPTIAARDVTLDQETTVLIEQAAAALVALDHAAPEAAGALGGFLLRSESVASSKIEHINADGDELALALAGHHAGAAAMQTAAAIVTLTSLVADAHRPLTERHLHEAHRALLGADPLEGRYAGDFRPMQNWIGGSDFSPRSALYVPPPPDLVPALMQDLLQSLRRDDLPALAQAAIVHAQFESIHPYTDGNGRIGRALINVALRRRGLTTRTVVPVASVMLSDTDRYFAQLTTYRQGDAQGFVRYVAESALVAASEAATSAVELQALPERWRERSRPRRGSTADTLLDVLGAHPVVDIHIATELTGSTRRRVYDALDRLTEVGVISEVTGRQRGRVWVASDVLDELDRLQDRIGRRRQPRARPSIDRR